MHLAIDLYIKLLKQVETHLKTAYSLRCVRLLKYFKLKPLTETVGSRAFYI